MSTGGVAGLAAVVGSLVAWAGRRSDETGSTTVCAPGEQKSCAFPGGTQGVQACAADGTAWGACDCSGAGGAAASGGVGGAGAAAGQRATGGSGIEWEREPTIKAWGCAQYGAL